MGSTDKEYINNLINRDNFSVMFLQEKEITLIFKALSHPVRLEIIRHLVKGPSCATLANRAVPVSQPNLSQHLKMLKSAGLVDCCSIGSKRCYYLCRSGFVTSILELLEQEHPVISRKGEDIISEIKTKQAWNE